MKKQIIKLVSFISIILISLIITLSYFLNRDIDKINYGLLIKVENKTQYDFIVTIFSVPLSTNDFLSNQNIEHVYLKSRESNFQRFYMGKKVNFADTLIVIMAWETSSMKSKNAINKPYLIRTYYNPQFKIGPEKYGTFADFTIDESETQRVTSDRLPVTE